MTILRFLSTRRLLFLVVAVFGLLLVPSRPVAAADGDASQPLMIVGFPNMDRMVEIIEQLTTLVGREDIKDEFVAMIRKQMERQHRDPTQPNAQMVFMQPGFPPAFVSVEASPITDADKYLDGIKDMFQFVDKGQLRQVKDEENFWEFTNPEESEGFYVAVRIVDGYAYRSFDRKFSALNLKGLHREIGPVVGRSDVGLAVFPEAVPPGLRQVFVTFLRNAIAAELQQKDGEPEASYLARKSTGNYFLDLLEQILNQSDGASLGLTVKDDGSVAIDAYIDAAADSKLAAFLGHFGGKTSRFQNLVNDPSADTLHFSFALDEATREWLTQLVDSAGSMLGMELELENPKTHPIAGLFDSLKATLKSGHFDFILQVYGQPFEALVFTGGMRIQDGAGVGNAIRELLIMISERTDDVKITVDADSYEGVNLHTLEIVESDAGADAFFGGKPVLWIGASQSTIWFAFGGGECFLELTSVIDRVKEGATENPTNQSSITAIGHFGRWFSAFMAAEDQSRDRRRRRIQDSEAADAAAVRSDAAPAGTPQLVEVEVSASDALPKEVDEEQAKRQAERLARQQEMQKRAEGMQEKIRAKMTKILAEGDDEMKFRLTTSETGLKAEVRFGSALSKSYVTAAITGFETFMRNSEEAEALQQEAIQRAVERQQRQQQNP